MNPAQQGQWSSLGGIPVVVIHLPPCLPRRKNASLHVSADILLCNFVKNVLAVACRDAFLRLSKQER